MVYFPERQQSGTWAARPVFTKRISAHRRLRSIEGAEYDLYDRYHPLCETAERPCRGAGGTTRVARAVGFLMALSTSGALPPVPTPCGARLKIAPGGWRTASSVPQELVRHTAPPELPDLERVGRTRRR